MSEITKEEWKMVKKILSDDLWRTFGLFHLFVYDIDKPSEVFIRPSYEYPWCEISPPTILGIELDIVPGVSIDKNNILHIGEYTLIESPVTDEFKEFVGDPDAEHTGVWWLFKAENE